MFTFFRSYGLRRPRSGSAGLALVLAFYLVSQGFIDSLGPNPGNWAGAQAQQARLLPHPAFFAPPKEEYAARRRVPEVSES